MAWATKEARQRLMAVTTDNLRAFFGRPSRQRCYAQVILRGSRLAVRGTGNPQCRCRFTPNGPPSCFWADPQPVLRLYAPNGNRTFKLNHTQPIQSQLTEMESQEKHTLKSVVILGPAYPFRGGWRPLIRLWPAHLPRWALPAVFLPLRHNIRRCCFPERPSSAAIPLPKESISRGR